jgi:phosphotransferase system  glucose/maltose/N-acetylglucosamine-specific IIC component
MGAIMQPAIPMFIVAGLLLGLKTVFVETGVMQKAPLVPTLQDINAMPVFDAVF